MFPNITTLSPWLYAAAVDSIVSHRFKRRKISPKRLLIHYYAKRFRKYSNRIAKLTFLSPKNANRRFTVGKEAKEADRAIDKYTRYASKAVGLDKPYVKERFPDLLTVYYQSLPNTRVIMVVGYEAGFSCDPGIKKQLESLQVDLNDLECAIPSDQDDFMKNRMLFTLFPGLDDYVCYEPSVENIAKGFSHYQDHEKLLLVLRYLGYTTL